MEKKIYLSTSAVILLIFASAFIFSASQKTTKYSLLVPYTIDMAKANFDVYSIKGPDPDNSSNIRVDYYNTDKLDEFIKAASGNAKSKIRIIKYASANEGCELKWMYDIECDSGRYKLNIYSKDSIVNNQYKPVFTKVYETLKKISDNQYMFLSDEEQDFYIL